MKKNKLFGFTLAETLITLAIIGVVAALTIPNMITRHQKREIEVGLQKTYAELSNWFKMAENDFGTFDNWGISPGMHTETALTQFVQEYIAPYMKLTRCTVAKRPCFAGRTLSNVTSYYYPTKTKEPGVLTNFLGIAYLLPDGRALQFYANAYDWTPPGKFLEICADVNGPKGRAVLGQDIFCFSIYSFRGPSYRPANTFGVGFDGDYSSTTALIRDCPTASAAKQCGLLLQRNGWKFPDNYPIKF